VKNTEKLHDRISALEEQIISGPNKPMNLMETAAYLGLSPSYIYKLTYKQIIPHYKPTGKRVYFFKKEIDEWIRKSSFECSVMSDELKEKETNNENKKDPQQIEMEITAKKK